MSQGAGGGQCESKEKEGEKVMLKRRSFFMVTTVRLNMAPYLKAFIRKSTALFYV